MHAFAPRHRRRAGRQPRPGPAGDLAARRRPLAPGRRRRLRPGRHASARSSGRAGAHAEHGRRHGRRRPPRTRRRGPRRCSPAAAVPAWVAGEIVERDESTPRGWRLGAELRHRRWTTTVTAGATAPTAPAGCRAAPSDCAARRVRTVAATTEMTSGRPQLATCRPIVVNGVASCTEGRVSGLRARVSRRTSYSSYSSSRPRRRRRDSTTPSSRRAQLTLETRRGRCRRAVLQLAGDLRLLGLGPAAPHGSTPSDRARGPGDSAMNGSPERPSVGPRFGLAHGCRSHARDLTGTPRCAVTGPGTLRGPGRVESETRDGSSGQVDRRAAAPTSAIRRSASRSAATAGGTPSSSARREDPPAWCRRSSRPCLGPLERRSPRSRRRPGSRRRR